MRVVFDTNVLVSAFIFPGGTPEAAYRLVLERRIEPVTTRPLLVELARVLASKFGWDDQRVEEAVAQVVRLAVVVETTEKVQEIAADPSADRVLEAASAGQADVIVSGDRHLLGLERWRGIEIVRPAKLVAKLA